MNAPPSSAEVSTDTKKMTWISTLWMIYCQEEHHARPSAGAVEDFLDSLVLPPVTRPTIFREYSGVIQRALEETSGLALTRQAILVVQRWAAASSRNWTANKLYEPRQARGLTTAEVDRLICFLWFRQWTSNSFKCTALIAFIAARTGKMAKLNEITQTSRRPVWRGNRIVHRGPGRADARGSHVSPYAATIKQE